MVLDRSTIFVFVWWLKWERIELSIKPFISLFIYIHLFCLNIYYFVFVMLCVFVYVDFYHEYGFGSNLNLHEYGVLL